VAPDDYSSPSVPVQKKHKSSYRTIFERAHSTAQHSTHERNDVRWIACRRRRQRQPNPKYNAPPPHKPGHVIARIALKVQKEEAPTNGRGS